jgi:hypothetical protein
MAPGFESADALAKSKSSPEYWAARKAERVGAGKLS